MVLEICSFCHQPSIDSSNHTATLSTRHKATFKSLVGRTLESYAGFVMTMTWTICGRFWHIPLTDDETQNVKALFHTSSLSIHTDTHLNFLL